VTRDFKARATPKQKGRTHRSCLFWFVSGALLGAFAIGLLWLQLDPALWRSGSGLAKTGVPRPQVNGLDRPPPSTSLEFEFPDLLREMEVMVPDDEEPEPEPPPIAKPIPKPEPAISPKPEKKVAAPAKPSTPPSTEREAYMLQLGSFRNAKDAERLKARLALMGIETRIQEVTIDGKATFHRVRSGPYRNHQELDEIRRMLTRNNIKTIIIRWKS
jgi:hypothetical protein